MKDWLKFITGWTICFILRLVPLRPPNVEPILTTIMPFSKAYGPKASFIFSFLSILIFDLFTQKVGQWTIITGLAYGTLGLGAYVFFKNRKGSVANYLTFAVIGTLLYDAVTGVALGPIMFGMSLSDAFFGQIPFTINHLLGNIALSVTLSPLIQKWIVTNQKFSVLGLKSWLLTHPS